MSDVEGRLAALEQSRSELIALLGNLSSTQSTSDQDTSRALDVVWLLLNSFLIFLMQIGFCMLEAGAVTSKSTESIMMKNAIDAAITGLVWWAVGHALAFGTGSGFVGVATPSLFFMGGVDDAYEWATFFFHLNFAMTASTIVSGAIAERAHILSYLLFSTLCAAIIYPVVVHWQWSSSGWASPTSPDALLGGVVDFAGGGAVHVMGGVAALCAAAIIGPRRGRFDPLLEPVTGVSAPAAADGSAAAAAPRATVRSGGVCGWRPRSTLPMPGHSSVLLIMGTFILWVGW